MSEKEIGRFEQGGAPNAKQETDLDAGSVKLDLSSLNVPQIPEDEKKEAEIAVAALNSEALYRKTVNLLEGGEVDLEHGLMLLKKAAEDGCALSWLHLGKLYGDEQSALYNPALAFECFSGAAALDNGDGYYNLGLCHNAGIGCDVSEDEAVNCFLNGAKIGNADCICALGVCREFGIGCEINYEMAAGLYARAAEDGCATAINNLGGCYFYGHGVAQDKARALELFEQAAALGNASAECRLGICRETGDCCDRDRPMAFEHYQRAAEKGNATALYRLALCYDKGIGTEQNFAEAYQCYGKAANAGFAPAMYEAGMMSKSGRGTKKNLATAYKMFSAAASAGISDAEYEVGNCYFDGLGTVRNRESAYARYQVAYQVGQNNAKAAFRLGLCNLKGLGTEKNEAEAFDWFCKGAALGSKGAMYMKGECLFFGIGTEENKSAAAECFSMAISYEYEDSDRMIPSMLALAQCLEHGLGVDKDPEKALELYKKAAEQGDAEAMYLTGRAILSGVGMRAEYAAARAYILRAARKEFVPALEMMGYFADVGKGVPQNKNDAKRWYTMAINKEVDPHPALFDFPERFQEKLKRAMEARLEAQYRLGMLLPRMKEVTTADLMQAFEYLAVAASLDHAPAQTEIAKISVHGGDLKGYYDSPDSQEGALFPNGGTVPDNATLADAMNKLGDAMFNGSGIVKKNQIAAVRCYRIAANLGNNDACYSYGWCLRHGKGVRENDAEAVKWLKLSADRGNQNAAYSYGLCCEEGAGMEIKNKREALTYYRKAAASGHVDAAQRYILLSERED